MRRRMAFDREWSRRLSVSCRFREIVDGRSRPCGPGLGGSPDSQRLQHRDEGSQGLDVPGSKTPLAPRVESPATTRCFADFEGAKGQCMECQSQVFRTSLWTAYRQIAAIVALLACSKESKD